MATARVHRGKKVVKRKTTMTEQLVKVFVIGLAVVIALALVFSLAQRF